MNIYNINYDTFLKEIDENILWQYDNATNLKKIIEFKKDFFKQYYNDFWKNFEKDIYNINTANEFGLTIWGLLLQVSRYYYINGEKKIIELEMYRTFLKSRMYYMIINCSSIQILKYIKMIIGEDKEIIQNTILEEKENMTINYILTWYPTEEEKELYFNTDILPRPAGVKLILYKIDKEFTFGFAGSNLQPFNQGTFWDGKNIVNN